MCELLAGVALVRRCLRLGADDAVRVCVAHDNFSVGLSFLTLLLKGGVVLLLDVVVVPIEQFLN